MAASPEVLFWGNDEGPAAPLPLFYSNGRGLWAKPETQMLICLVPAANYVTMSTT